MAGRVIQGFFIGGAVRPQPATRAEARGRHPTGAPPPAFAGRAAPLQARMAPGRPSLAHRGAGYVVQRHGGNGSFEIDPVQLGLARGGGKPLAQAVLAKMEAAFGADFSAVRVHVGPQASRIGAVAFTTGNDLYFAPGRYQPESAQGLQLLGHELAHVVQQRQGRVSAPGSGVAVVQDRMLEAEADRLGMRAAMARPAATARTGWGKAVSRAIQRAEETVDEKKSTDYKGDLAAVTAILTWLKAKDLAGGGQCSNYSVGLTDKGFFIISKVGGITSAHSMAAPLKAYLAETYPKATAYLAPSHNSTASPSGNHAEMCVAAAQNAETGKVTTIMCTDPNCELCETQMTHMDITGGSISPGSAGSQLTWTHPNSAAFFGTSYGTMKEAVSALVAFNNGEKFTKGGSVGSTKPKQGGARKL